MREIGQLESEKSAAIFSDYLLARGVRTEIRPDASGVGVSLWVIDENRLAESRSALSEFLANPNDSRFANSARAANEIRKAEVRANKEYARRVTDAGSVYASGQLLRRTPVVKAVIAICVIVTLWANFGKRMTSDGENLSLKYINLTTPRYDYNDGWVLDDLKPALSTQPWRLVAPMFLHLSWLHLFFNMSFMTYYGAMIEREKKSGFLVFLIIFTQILSALSEYAWQVYAMNDKVVMFGGFSGVGYGLFGFVWMYSEYNNYGYIRMDRQNFQYGLIWLVVCFTGMVGPIANGAHLGGMVAGMLIGIISGQLDARKNT